MIKNVNQNIISQHVRKMGLNLDGSTRFARSLEKASHARVNQAQKNKGIAVKSLETKNARQSGVGADTLAYFSKATGKPGRVKGKRFQQAKKQKPAEIDINDRIKMSLEAKQEVKAERGEISAFKQKNPLNMKAFCENLGLEAPQQKLPDQEQEIEKMSLAQKLEMVSLKTRGRGW